MRKVEKEERKEYFINLLTFKLFIKIDENIFMAMTLGKITYIMYNSMLLKINKKSIPFCSNKLISRETRNHVYCNSR
jgi:hypothetical protein